MKLPRSSGILAHITSLPSPFGIGDLGVSSYDFIDFLVKCNQSYWQFLPTVPTNTLFDDSPYMSTSAFAGSPHLISPDLLFESGLISKRSISSHPEFSPYTTNYRAAGSFKSSLLKEAYSNFSNSSTLEYQSFIESNNYWLDDYSLFMALKEKNSFSLWSQWPRDIASRKANALHSFRNEYISLINYYVFEQYIFYSQWNLLRDYASENNISLFGDIPIYVGYDSADVWAHPDIFLLDSRTQQPTLVSGVPPDYFSETGQRWGNPLYNWDTNESTAKSNLYKWWENRLAMLFFQVDIARIDHFRGFEAYWAIPAEEPTAMNGKWRKGPGRDFFAQITANLGVLNIIAEDLGIITPEVEKLRDTLGFPGMKVLQFGFDNDIHNSHLPYNYATPNCVTYTGTHDNDTTVGWFLSDKLDDNLRKVIKNMTNRTHLDAHSIHTDLIYLAQSSISNLTIFPLQDILGFGNDCKMNSPGSPTGNWKWRCSKEFLTVDIAQAISSSTDLFGRGRKM